MSDKTNTKTFKVGSAIFCSRILGLIRESIFAAIFGASTAMDAYNVAFRIPNLLRDLFAEGALSSAFVTTFSSLKTNEGKAKAFHLACQVITLISLVVGSLVLIGQLFSKDIVMIYAGAFEDIPGKIELSTHLMQIMFPFLLIVSISSVLVGLLNSFNHFGLPALAPSLFNVGTIVGGTTLAFTFKKFDIPMIYGMAIGTLIGGLLQWLLLFPLTRKTDFHFCFTFSYDKHVISMVKLMVPAVIGLSAVQINLFVTTNFASKMVEGSISWLTYAFRLMQLPIGIFGVAIATVSLPNLASLIAQRLDQKFRQTLDQSIRMCFFLTLPASFGLWMLSENIIRCIYRWNAFQEPDVLFTAQALKAYSLGLIFYSLVKVLAPAFYAQNRTLYPVLGTLFAIITNIILCFVLAKDFQHSGLALATSLAASANAIFLFLIGQITSWSLNIISLCFYILRVSIACIVMSWIVISLKSTVENIFLNASQLINILSLAIYLITGIICYFVICKILKINEASILTQFTKKILP